MIKKSLFLVVMVLNISMMTHAMITLDTKFKLPSACQLKKNFEQGGLGGFAYETDIHEFLDNKEMSLGLISNVADTFRAQYLEKVYKSNPNLEGMRPDDLLKKEKILACILRRVSVVEKIDSSTMQSMDDLTRIMHMPIALPKKGELANSLCNAGFGSFVSISNIDEDLHSSWPCPLLLREIIKIIDDRINYYNDFRHNRYRGNSWLWLEQEDRQKIIQIILCDFPEVYQMVCKYEAQKQSKL